MARLVPALAGAPKLNKVLIVNETIQYLHDQRNMCIAAARDLQSIINANKSLTAEVKALRWERGQESLPTLQEPPLTDALCKLMTVEMQSLGTSPVAFSENITTDSWTGPGPQRSGAWTNPLLNLETLQSTVAPLQVDQELQLPTNLDELPFASGDPSSQQDDPSTARLLSSVTGNAFWTNPLLSSEALPSTFTPVEGGQNMHMPTNQDGIPFAPSDPPSLQNGPGTNRLLSPETGDSFWANSLINTETLRSTFTMLEGGQNLQMPMNCGEVPFFASGDPLSLHDDSGTRHFVQHPVLDHGIAYDSGS